MDDRAVMIGRSRRVGGCLLAIAALVQLEVEAGVLSMSMVLKEPESGETGIYRLVFDCAEVDAQGEGCVRELGLELDMERLAKLEPAEFRQFLVGLRAHVREAIDGKGKGNG